MNRRVIF